MGLHVRLRIYTGRWEIPAWRTRWNVKLTLQNTVLYCPDIFFALSSNCGLHLQPPKKTIATRPLTHSLAAWWAADARKVDATRNTILAGPCSSTETTSSFEQWARRLQSVAVIVPSEFQTDLQQRVSNLSPLSMWHSVALGRCCASQFGFETLGAPGTLSCPLCDRVIIDQCSAFALLCCFGYVESPGKPDVETSEDL